MFVLTYTHHPQKKLSKEKKVRDGVQKQHEQTDENKKEFDKCMQEENITILTVTL